MPDINPEFENQIAHKIIAECSKGMVASDSQLAKKIGVSPTGLWYCMTARRKWKADMWLKALAALGVVKIYQNKITINLDTSVCSEISKYLRD